MCGIAAIFRSPDNCRHRLKGALGKIAHRGSSLNEYAIFDSAGLGANRLPIVGKLNGSQPRFNKTQTLATVLNGEIFNYRDLNISLQSKGYEINGDSDTETLLHLYQEYGPDCIGYIDSEMFAFVIYETANRSFFAARDILGLKPLYYAETSDSTFYFASEIKALAQFDDILTILEFPPGHICRDGKFEKYPTVTSKALPSAPNFEQAKIRIRDCLVEAVQKRLPMDQPVAVLLSGGVDSSLVMAIANENHPNVTAFILGTEESQDRVFAERLCLEKKWKYNIVSADINYEAELPDIIYGAGTDKVLVKVFIPFK